MQDQLSFLHTCNKTNFSELRLHLSDVLCYLNCLNLDIINIQDSAGVDSARVRETNCTLIQNVLDVDTVCHLHCNVAQSQRGSASLSIFHLLLDFENLSQSPLCKHNVQFRECLELLMTGNSLGYLLFLLSIYYF